LAPDEIKKEEMGLTISALESPADYLSPLTLQPEEAGKPS
jgi:hypothetical protein